VAEPEREDPRNGATPPKWDRTELVSTTVALLWVSIVALVDAVFGGKFGLIGFLAIGRSSPPPLPASGARHLSGSTPRSSP